MLSYVNPNWRLFARIYKGISLNIPILVHTLKACPHAKLFPFLIS